MFNRFHRATKGEIALALTIIASVLIVTGIIAGTKVVQLQTNTNSQASAPTETPTPSPCDENISSWTPTTNTVAPIGPKVATNIHPVDYKQIRALYNCRFPNFQSQWIPVTVVYPIDYVHLSDNDDPPNVGNKDSESMKFNLIAMKSYGLFPIIRIATQYTNGAWIAISPADSSAIGQALSQAIKNASFPGEIIPIVYFGNEVNLAKEWSNKPDAGNFADALRAFIEGMDGTLGRSGYKIYFPPMSYGASTANGDILPPDFLQTIACTFGAKGYKTKIDGGALTIYENSFQNAQNRYNSSANDLKTKLKWDTTSCPGFNNITGPGSVFNSDTPLFMVTELGPTRQSQTIADKQNWLNEVLPIYQGYLSNPSTLNSLATTAFFDTSALEHLVVVYKDGVSADIICFKYYGSSVPADCASNPTLQPGPSSTPNPNNPSPTSGGGGNPSPTSAGGGGNPTATPNPNPTSPPGGGAPTSPPGRGGTLDIKVYRKIGNEKTLWKDSFGKAQVYISGPAGRGGFSVVMDVPTSSTSTSGNCTSDPRFESGGKGLPFKCNPGEIIWTPTSPGSYSVQISLLPRGLAPTPYPHPGVSVTAGKTTNVELVVSPGTFNPPSGKKGNATPTPEPTLAGTGYTNTDYEKVILQYAQEQISPLSVSAWLSTASRVPGLQTATCYPPSCEFGE